jgi:hypothetical protein
LFKRHPVSPSRCRLRQSIQPQRSPQDERHVAYGNFTIGCALRIHVCRQYLLWSWLHQLDSDAEGHRGIGSGYLAVAVDIAGFASKGEGCVKSGGRIQTIRPGSHAEVVHGTALKPRKGSPVHRSRSGFGCETVSGRFSVLHNVGGCSRLGCPLDRRAVGRCLHHELAPSR